MDEQNNEYVFTRSKMSLDGQLEEVVIRHNVSRGEIEMDCNGIEMDSLTLRAFCGILHIPLDNEE